MKRKNIFIHLLSISLITGFSAHAANQVFHLKNKSKDAIEINIKQNYQSLTGGFKRVAKGSTFTGGEKGTRDPQLNIPTVLELRYCPTAGGCKTTPQETLIVSFPAGKSIYIKFDTQNRLLPQKGSQEVSKKLGLGEGVTTSLYSLKNNVKPADMTVVNGTARKTTVGIEPLKAAQQQQAPQKNQAPQSAWQYATPAEKMSPLQAEEAGWKLYPEANALRKSKLPTITLEKKDPQAAKLARKVLGLGQTYSSAELQNAYNNISNIDKSALPEQARFVASAIPTMAFGILLNELASSQPQPTPQTNSPQTSGYQPNQMPQPSPAQPTTPLQEPQPAAQPAAAATMSRQQAEQAAWLMPEFIQANTYKTRTGAVLDYETDPTHAPELARLVLGVSMQNPIAKVQDAYDALKKRFSSATHPAKPEVKQAASQILDDAWTIFQQYQALEGTQDPVEAAWKTFSHEAQVYRKGRTQLSPRDPDLDVLASSILGVGPGASSSEIKKAQFKLIRTYHPDVFKGSQEVGNAAAQLVNDAAAALLKTGDFSTKFRLQQFLADENVQNLLPVYTDKDGRPSTIRDKLAENYTRATLMEARNIIQGLRGMKQEWKNMVSSLIDEELRTVKQ